MMGKWGWEKDAEAEIEALKRERDELKHDVGQYIETTSELLAEIKAMQAVVEAARGAWNMPQTRAYWERLREAFAALDKETGA